MAQGFQNNPDWDALFGDVVFVDAQGRKIYQREEAIYDFKVLLYAVDYICHQALFVRKTAYERLGGYRHKEFLKATDYEFKLRLGRAGCRAACRYLHPRSLPPRPPRPDQVPRGTPAPAPIIII